MAVVCGTGGFTGPLPGDPDNNPVLSATPVFGGIEVKWTYPTINPAAVAHVKLYRNTVNDFLTSPLLDIVNSTFYFDQTDPIIGEIQYWYWIEIVSVNGTVGDPIGPVTATAQPLINDLLQQLTAKIDNGVLATSLKTEIQRIEQLGLDLDQEALNRVSDNDALMALVSTYQTESAETRALILSEQTTRANSDGALAASIDAAYVDFEGTEALVLTEQQARIDGDSALAAQITTVQTETADNLAAVQVSLQTNIDTVDGKVDDIGALYTVQLTVDGLVGGFGVYNDGTSVDAGFDVDSFFIGRTSTDKKKPFILSGGVVYLDTAVIEDVSINFGKIAKGDIFDLTVGNEIKSTGYSAGISGWRIAPDGSAEFNGGTFRGAVEFTSAPSGQDNIDFANIGGSKPPADADRTATNTAAGITGQGSLATKNSVDYGSDVSGTKPPSDADRTSSNTAFDTSRVAGTTASTIRDRATVAESRVSSWQRTSTTLIDGNKIFTGDAYVDTLQIQGDAVVVPAFDGYTGPDLVGNNTLRDLSDGLPYALVTLAVPGDIVVLWTVEQKAQTSGTTQFDLGIYNSATGSYHWQIQNKRNIDEFLSGSFRLSLGAGTHGFAMAWKGDTSAVTFYDGTIILLGVQR